MMPERERIVHENPPTPQQLQKLANIGMRSAAAREKLRSPSKIKGHYCVDEIDFELPLSVAQDPAQIRHRVAVRAGRRLDAVPGTDGATLPVHSLKYFNHYSVYDLSRKDYMSSRIQYKFEWTRGKALLAQRSLRFIDQTQPSIDNDLGDDILQFRLDDDAAQMLHTEEEFRHLSYGDVELQIEEMEQYYQHVVGCFERQNTA